MSRRPFLAGNWKMHGTRAEAERLLDAVKKAADAATGRDVLVAPPYTLLDLAARSLAQSRVWLAAQDVFWEAQGAYTGAISPAMLSDTGCSHVIIGHSERRQYFGETDATVNKKVRAALEHGLAAIVCVGETLAERERGATLEVVEKQVRGGLEGLEPAAMKSVTLAYEPVWAIGTGKVATPAQAQEVHATIRDLLGQMGGAAADMRVLYGGSVKPDNVDVLMAQPDIDGALVGGASLQADAFQRIVHYRES